MTGNQQSLDLLDVAQRLFQRLDARTERDSVGGSDNYTLGHCERVALNAVAVGRALGLDEHALTSIRLGAYLHDLGKVRVPHDVLNKPGPLTQDEFEMVQMHPVWGIELLEGVEFPWDIKPVIRWHHEKYDGSGYPDRLRGDEIPLSAQIVGIVDVYDALTTDRAYRNGLTHDQALAEITRCRASWSDQAFAGFLAAIDETALRPGNVPAPA